MSVFFFSSRRRHTRYWRDWSSDVCSSDLLDPLASGVLPVALGEATKLAGRMLDSDKVYEFTIRFGEETDTLDAEGEVVGRSEIRPTSAALYPVLTRFVGPSEQVPPAFSAIKVDGRRAYRLARE